MVKPDEPLSKWRSLLSSRYVPATVAALALLLTAPSLRVGWVLDDHIQRLRLVGSEKLPEFPVNPARFFTFADGDPQHTHRLMDLGLWPWWTYPHIHAAFWRPLSVLTHRLDYSLWPDRPEWMHLQSMAWYAALAVVVALLYRRILGATWVAGLAALLYAIDDARGMAVGFLANRNAVIATVFGVGAILAHDRWRRGPWKPGAFLGPLLFLTALLSAEFGVGALAYLVAHTMVLNRAPWRTRCLVLAPYLVVLIGWRIAWQLAGAGMDGVGAYVDPLTEPWRFLSEAAQRIPVLLLGQWALPPSELYILNKDFGWFPIHWAIAMMTIVVLVVFLRPLIREDRTARFWTMGMLLALVPIVAAFPGDRLLLFVGVGAFGIMAQYFARPRTSGLARLFAVGLVGIHAVLAPAFLAVRSAMPVGPPSVIKRCMVPPITDPAVERQTVVLVTAPVVLSNAYLRIEQAFSGLSVPVYVRGLASHQPPVEVRRADDRTLVIRPAGGFLRLTMDQLARTKCHQMALGERVELTGMTATVLSLTEDDRPAEVEFRFDRPLEDESIRWLVWSPRGFEAFRLPLPGETAVVGRGRR